MSFHSVVPFLIDRNAAMEWTEQHDVFLCREILAVDLFKTKKKTTKRAEMWQKIADNLSSYGSPKFSVTKRAVRDRYGIISDKYKKKIRSEEKASGIQVDETELGVLLEEVVERENLAEEECNEGKKKMEDEKQKAVDIRKTAMESLSQTRKRKVSEESAGKKSRRSGSEAIDYLREKSREELRIKEEEMQLKKEQQALEVRQHEAGIKRHEAMEQMMAQQQQQMLKLMQDQQQQTNNFQNMMAQQSQLLAGLVAKLLPK